MLDSVNDVARLTSEATSNPQSFRYAIILALRSGGYGSTTANLDTERSRNASIAATMLVVQGAPIIPSSWLKSLVSNPLPWLNTSGAPPWITKSQDRLPSSRAHDSTCDSACLYASSFQPSTMQATAMSPTPFGTIR